IAADEPQQRVDEEAPRQHQPDNRADGVERQHLARRCRRIGRRTRQRRDDGNHRDDRERSEEHTSELQSLMRISYAVFRLKKKKEYTNTPRPRLTEITPQ